MLRQAQQGMGGGRRPRRRRRVFRSIQELGHIMRAAGFDACSQGGFAHAAEGLPQNNGAGGAAVDVKIAGLDALLPKLLLARSALQRM
jgi:hypothetical protein